MSSSKLPDKYKSWRIQLYNGSGHDYHLWLRPAAEIFAHHHDDTCCCDVRAREDLPPRHLDGDCYDAVGAMSYVTDLREAHHVVERGLGGVPDGVCRDLFRVRASSVVNGDVGAVADGPRSAFVARDSPYFGDGGHPAAEADSMRVFTVQGGNVQEEGPNRGNVGFTAKIPVSMVLRGEAHLFCVEFAEFRGAMACRYLLTRRPRDELARKLVSCDLTDPKSTLYFDGHRLRALKRAKTLTSQRLLPLIHGDEIICDDSMYPWLDSACKVTHVIPLTTQVPRGDADPCFDDSCENISQFLLTVYIDLLNSYNDLNLWFAHHKDNFGMETPRDIDDILSDEVKKMLQGFETTISAKDAFDFDLTDELMYPAPHGEDGLQRNCILIYQAIRGRQERMEMDVISN